MENNKSYYAIIPATVRYDKKLNANAKLLYGEITALCNQDGYCWAGNSYFANLYDVSKVTISRWIKSLIECEYIESKIIYKKGTKEIEQRRIYIKPYNQNCIYPINNNVSTPINNNVKDNNTINNNTINNNTNYYVSKKFLNDVIEKWNSIEEITDVRKIVENTERYKNIARRIKETSEDEFLEVIDLVSKSRFLRGYNNNGWKVPNIDWILNKNKYYKILEGSYNDRNNNIKDNVSVENIPEQGTETKFGKTF